MPLPPLNALRTFEVAARHLNFTKAAQELCVTPGAVSRAITHLEQSLKVPLFKQHKRQLQLTVAGQAYWFQVSQALRALSLATDELQQHRGLGGVLKLGILPTLGERWLIPQLPAFYQAYPEVCIELVTLPSDFSKTFTELDLETHGVDAALYVGLGQWSGIESYPLFQERLVPVAARQMEPTLRALAAGEPSAQSHLLLHTTRPHVWAEWFSAQGLDMSAVQWRSRLEHYFLVIEAAISGIGIALVPECLVQQELARGQLFALNEAAVPQPQWYCLLHHKARRHEHKIACFAQWLLDKM